MEQLMLFLFLLVAGDMDAPPLPKCCLPLLDQLAWQLEFVANGEVCWDEKATYDNRIWQLRNYRDQVWGCPLLQEAEPFPDTDLLKNWIAQNRRYKQWLETYAELCPMRQLECWEFARRCDEAYYIYQDIVTARNYLGESIINRRQALHHARLLLGNDFYWGRLPPCVPVTVEEN